MDDIDDYFDDDLVLDERTLAILEREEQKYLSQKQRQPPPPPAVTKKQKTHDGWSPGVGSRPREHDFDDLPEISVTVDGNYGFTDSTLTSGSLNLSQPPLPLVQAPQFNAPPQRGQNLSNGRSSPRAQPAPAPPQTTVSAASNRASPVPDARPKNITPTNLPISNEVVKQLELQKQITELQAQLQELKNDSQRIQTALKEATDVRYAKEGEVSILRKNIEKTAQSHAAEIAKMKAAREEMEAKQKQMERQMKEETERLKTQFMFKQHELEASFRRPPSARVTRFLKNVPATPVRVPSQISAWRINQDADFGQRLSQAPHRDPSLKPSPQAARIIHKSPEVVKRTGFLPGFQNTFTSTPLKPNTKIDLKGKGRDLGREELIEVPPQRLLPLAISPVHQHSADSFDPDDHVDVAPASDDPMAHFDEDGDSLMLNDNPEEVAEEVDPVKPLNHATELSRIVLTHTHMEANQTTLQLLISSPFITSLPDAQARECTHAARSILLALSSPVDSNHEICSRQVMNSLIMILQCLLDVDPCLPIAALLNLMRSLVLLLPFTKLLEPISDNGTLLFVVLFNLLDRLAGSSSDKGSICIKEIFSLLEILLFDIPDDTVNRLAPFLPTRINSLLGFLNASQSCETLESLSRVSLLLATHSPFHGQILTLVQDADSEVSDRRDSPFLHHLCTYLLDSFHSNLTQNSTTYGNLLSCLAQLSLSQAELLIQSRIVIPTLTYMIAEMSMMLWNDDGSSLTESQSRLFIRSINQTLFLLHHLIHSSEPIIRLHDKLQHCSHRNLNNLVHMFVVSFGQLSYADPPDWIDVGGKAELEGLVDIARDLLDLVVDGPEGDSIWAAYQMEPDNESETDDEEREARLMDSDMQS